MSLCGWIGPCPPVEFVSVGKEAIKNEPRHVRIKARRVAPIEYNADQDDNTVYIGLNNSVESISMRPDDDVATYISQMKDIDNWIVPESPVREISTVTLQSIKLKKFPADVNIAARIANKSISEKEAEDNTQYRASILFKIDNNEDPVTYTLYTNPIFVTPPSCHPGPKGFHEVHIRALEKYRKNIWTVDQLKNYKAEDMDEDVMVINATGKGAEILARAWCSERGKNAVICRQGGACYVCGFKAASKSGLGTGVLIWV
ncbi:hypothetical protein BT69DRAFT_1275273 [Atractiella rhizophila]|nr:hypothetical protein BT69DRAFT_1275273 [Atractiella rhizophila]